MTNNSTTYLVSTNNNSKGRQILSDEYLKVAGDILFVVRCIAVSMAVPLTLCNLVVFLNKNMRSTTAIYVIGLSVGQLVYVIGTTVQYVSLLEFSDPLNSLVYWVLFLYIGIYSGIVARRGTYVVMCLVSLQRLYAIVRPLQIKRFLLSRHPLVCMISAYAITAVLHTYILAKTKIRGISAGPNSNIIYRPVLTQLYIDHKAINDAFSLAAKILLNYCGLLTQILLNLLTICFLRRHNLTTQRMKSTTKEEAIRQRERQLTVTILAATISYVVLSLPSATHHFVYTVFTEYNGLLGQYRNVYTVVQDLTFILSVFSCCVDFVCFMMLSSNYRATFILILSFGNRNREEGVSDMANQLQHVE